MRAAGSSDRRTCSIDRAATSAGRACAAVAGVAASSGRRRTQAAIASMWNAARRAHGSLLSVPARRNRALALPGVLAAASAVLGACYSARIWHDGVFRLSANFALGTGSLSLRESGAYRSVFVVTSAALLPKKRAAQALLPARNSRPAPRQRKHGVTDRRKGPPTSPAQSAATIDLPEHENAALTRCHARAISSSGDLCAARTRWQLEYFHVRVGVSGDELEPVSSAREHRTVISARVVYFKLTSVP